MALLAEGILKPHWDQTIPVNVAHIVKQMGVRLLMPEPAVRYAVQTMQARDWPELAHVFAVPTLFVKQCMAELGLMLPRAVPRHLRGFTIDADAPLP